MRHFTLAVPFSVAAGALASALPPKGARLKYHGETRLRFAVGNEEAGTPGELTIRVREPNDLVAEGYSRPTTPPETRAQLQAVMREIPHVLGVPPVSDKDPLPTPPEASPIPVGSASPIVPAPTNPRDTSTPPKKN